MSIEKVKPVVDDGIEFYISSDETASGMSISGLSAFITVDRRVIGRLVEKINSTEDGLVELPECLKPFQGNALSPGLEGINRAKIIPSTTCEAIIFYYAYESDNISDEVKQAAKFAHRKFAQLGLHQHIKNISGCIEKRNEDLLLAEFRYIRTELESVKSLSRELIVIRNTTTAFMPGCKDLLDEIVESTGDDNLYLPTEDGALSIEGWLHNKGITLTSTKFRQLAHITAATFKSMTKQDPSKAHFKLVNGKTKYNVSVYEPQHFAIIQMCFNKILHDD
jgi:hypothetical protein